MNVIVKEMRDGTKHWLSTYISTTVEWNGLRDNAIPLTPSQIFGLLEELKDRYPKDSISIEAYIKKI